MSQATAIAREVTLTVGESTGKDIGRGLVRMDPADIRNLGADVGDLVEVVGQRTTICKLLPAFLENRGRQCVQLDGIVRENAGVAIGEPIVLRRADARSAAEVVLAPLGQAPSERDAEHIAGLLTGLPVVVGDRVRAALFGNRHADFFVRGVSPKGPVVLASDTVVKLVAGRKTDAALPTAAEAVSYEDIGGLGRQLERVREIVEWPLRRPELYDHLGIAASKGVLLVGPPGSGKKSLAHAVAHETGAAFLAVSSMEVLCRFQDEGETPLREIWDEAARRAPSIILIDEIDALAPWRDGASGGASPALAQLLTLIDNLSPRRRVMVLAAADSLDDLHPALRRPGRFDRVIDLPIPDHQARREIFEIHTRGMTLASDVRLSRLAGATRGFVGGDIAALCREAGTIALRRLPPPVRRVQGRIPYELIAQLEVTATDFQTAMREVEPTAAREAFVETPEVGWDDVGGLEDVKRRLREAVEWPMKHADLFRSHHVDPPRRLLISGPKGCGKTLLARALASETGLHFIAIKGTELVSLRTDEAMHVVGDLFRKARRAAPCIVFLDNLDALIQASDDEEPAGAGGRLWNRLLGELENADLFDGVLVVAAASRRDLLERASPRLDLFDFEIELPLPDRTAREKIFQVHLRDRPIARSITAGWLAGQTQGFSGAEIAAVCRRAATASLARRIDAPPETADDTAVEIRREDFEEAIGNLAPKTAGVEYE